MVEWAKCAREAAKVVSVLSSVLSSGFALTRTRTLAETGFQLGDEHHNHADQ
jgi:hypothetical protein